jgi:hypothetical protein
MKLSPWEPDLRTIVDRIDSSDIDLQPDFQRQEVWSTAKKKRLVDTVLRGWSIPPIHLVVTEESRMEVLDGQQRLATIRDFLHNVFSIDGNITPTDPRIAALHGKFYKSLEPAIRRQIDQYSLRCFRITDYLPEEPSELFYRLNQPTMLTAGEQRNALYGRPREQLKALVKDFENFGNDKNTIGFSNARLAYDDIIARVLFFLEIGSFAVKGTEALISERFRNRDGFPDDVVSRARQSLTLFSSARGQTGSWRFNKASLLSWLLFFLRFRHMQPEAGFMEAFYDPNNLRSGRKYVSEAIGVFQDRASLRVTDVSSVVFRDFALWYSYYYLLNPPLPASISAEAIKNIFQRLRGRDDVGLFAQALSGVLDLEQWGQSL